MAGKESEAGGTKTLCSLGKFLRGLEDLAKNAPEFRKHLDRSHLELLKAVKTLLDSKIKNLEKRDMPGKKKVARKITIE
ncbi:MAG: hypothetical protein JRD04_06315 [Deltaproteobacteria bacterium]|nr:hypothetical protein [Deltaproteobacteria bacterium]